MTKQKGTKNQKKAKSASTSKPAPAAEVKENAVSEAQETKQEPVQEPVVKEETLFSEDPAIENANSIVEEEEISSTFEEALKEVHDNLEPVLEESKQIEQIPVQEPVIEKKSFDEHESPQEELPNHENEEDENDEPEEQEEHQNASDREDFVAPDAGYIPEDTAKLIRNAEMLKRRQARMEERRNKGV